MSTVVLGVAGAEPGKFRDAANAHDAHDTHDAHETGVARRRGHR